MKKFLLILLFIITFTSCKKDNPSPLGICSTAQKNVVQTLDSLDQQYCSLNEAIYYTFKDWYLWTANIPSSVNYKNYSDPNTLIDAMRYTKDNWSFIADKTENDNLFENGQYEGQGLDFWYDLKTYYADDSKTRKLYITYVVENSAADVAGIYRGMQLTKMNGKSILALIDDANDAFSIEYNKSTITYTLIDTLGVSKDYTVTNGLITEKTVLYKNVYTVDSKKVGYLVFQSFLGTSRTELTDAFAYFKNQGIDDLVLDLRYNGGGYVDVAQKLASLIAGGATTTDDIFVYENFNSRYSEYNGVLKFTNESNKLNLSRVFIIGSRFTASASELVINGLKPHMEVLQIGEATHGKPVGFFPFTYQNTEIYPVSFESTNSNHVGGYYNGLIPNFSAYDGVKYPLGDSREYCFAAALSYIENGSFSSRKAARISRQDETLKFPMKTGLVQIRGSY